MYGILKLLIFKCHSKPVFDMGISYNTFFIRRHLLCLLPSFVLGLAKFRLYHSVLHNPPALTSWNAV